MKEFNRNIKGGASKFLRELDNQYVQRKNEAFNEGYNEAANICLGIITKKIDELYSQINSDSFLSEREQFMLLTLKELKSETEEELRDFWSGNQNKK